jgi:hypothetical protein
VSHNIYTGPISLDVGFLPKGSKHWWSGNIGPVPHIIERVTLFDNVGFLRGFLLHYITNA